MQEEKSPEVPNTKKCLRKWKCPVQCLDGCILYRYIKVSHCASYTHAIKNIMKKLKIWHCASHSSTQEMETGELQRDPIR